MKFNPFCMCCAVSKQEQNIRSFQNMDKKVEYMKKVMDRMANIAEEVQFPADLQNSGWSLQEKLPYPA